MPDNSGIRQSIGHGLRGIARFSGRDSRAQFWPYAIAVMLANIALSMAVGVPMLFGGLLRMRNLAERYPDQFEVYQTPTSYSINYIGNDPAVAAQVMPDVGSFFLQVWAAAAVTAILLAAACGRRLHDRANSSKWLLVPLIFAMPGLTLFPGLFSELTTDAESIGADFYWRFAALLVGNLIYLGSLALLAVLMMQRGDAGENRFGPPPT